MTTLRGNKYNDLAEREGCMSMISEDIQIIQLDRMFVCKKLQINSNSQRKKYKKLLRLYTRVIKCTTILCNLRLGMHLHPLHFFPESHILLSPSSPQSQPTIYTWSIQIHETCRVASFDRAAS